MVVRTWDSSFRLGILIIVYFSFFVRCCVDGCRFARIGSTWRWCWIVSSSGYLLWLSSLARQPSFCRRPLSTTTANPSTSNSPRFSALSAIGISTKMQFEDNKTNRSLLSSLFSRSRVTIGCFCYCFFVYVSIYSSPLSLSVALFFIWLFVCFFFFNIFYISIFKIVSVSAMQTSKPPKKITQKCSRSNKKLKKEKSQHWSDSLQNCSFFSIFKLLFKWNLKKKMCIIIDYYNKRHLCHSWIVVAPPVLPFLCVIQSSQHLIALTRASRTLEIVFWCRKMSLCVCRCVFGLLASWCV